MLDRLADRLPGPAVLVPTDDAGAILLAEHGDKLRPRYLFPDPPSDLPRRAAGKASLAEICRAAGVPHPATTVRWTPPRPWPSPTPADIRSWPR